MHDATATATATELSEPKGSHCLLYSLSLLSLLLLLLLLILVSFVKANEPLAAKAASRLAITGSTTAAAAAGTEVSYRLR